MRKPAGEAAELIVRALTGAHSPALTLAELEERAGFPNATTHDGVERLRKAGELHVSEDDHGTLWVSLP